MSSKNIVNPDHYKVAGRDRPDENRPPDQPKPSARGAGRRRKKGDAPPANLIPGGAPVGEPATDDG